MLRFFTDTDTDITPEIAREYNATLISMPYSNDGKTVYPYVDWDEFDDAAFYQTLREGTMYSTSAISEEAYIKYFEPVFAAGDDILYVHFSAAMTVTFDNMQKAVDGLLEKYPGRKFYSIDTLGITTIGYIIVREVGDMLLAGKTADEIMEWSKTEIQHFAQYFFAEDLKFFRRSGRVSGLSATMGTLLGIRPIIYMSAEGKMESCGKEKGRRKAMERLISYVEELGDDIENHRICVGHIGAPHLAEELVELLKEKFPDKKLNIEIVKVNPTAGCHCGPDSAGITFHAIHR